MVGYGKHNEVVLQLGYSGQITGGVAEADIAGPHAYLPFRANLVDVRVVCRDINAGCLTTLIQVYAGVDLATGTAVLSAAMDPVDGAEKKVGSIIDVNKVYDIGQEFCLSENATNANVFDDPMVFLTFRKQLP